MPQNKQSTPFKCRRCKRQDHLVKNCIVPKRQKGCQAILARSEGSETSVLLAPLLEVFIITLIEIDSWETRVKQMEQWNSSYWNNLIYEPEQ